jgi:hypothetical protein
MGGKLQVMQKVGRNQADLCPMNKSGLLTMRHIVGIMHGKYVRCERMAINQMKDDK